MFQGVRFSVFVLGKMSTVEHKIIILNALVNERENKQKRGVLVGM